jgi:hypothetical protein
MKRSMGIYPIICLIACGLAALLINAAPLPVPSFQKDASGVTITLWRNRDPGGERRR